jgi:hypothetical protein
MFRLCFRCLPLLLVVLQVSCTTYYKNPSKDTTTHAVLTSKGTGGYFKYEVYKVERVDSVPVNYEWESVRSKKLVLTPGRHAITLRAEHSLGLNSIPHIAREDFTLVAEPGRAYSTNGYIEGSKAVMWIEDSASRKVVTDKKKAQLHNPGPQGPPVMIFLPVG